MLRKRGLDREMTQFEIATLEGFDIILAPNATLVPSVNGLVYGVLAHLTQAELDMLYSQDWLSDYKPRKVALRDKAGREAEAICYIAPPRLGVSPRPDYVAQLVETAASYGFPSWYLERLRKAGIQA